ncbi:FHA domain-containing protein [Archangium lipolyticum]|uniref:FHA domain-containing protein n=1 Tax=Archangium lipolyticum TaxID=2970465 RepID=UPI00214A2C4D|nr:FHA domain-containing protein [Archangium lipolyticum]
MHFEFEHMNTATPFELPEGVHLLGGGAEDHVRLEGLPDRLLTLRIEADRLMVEATRTFTVAGVMVPPGVSRLVLPGEVVGLPETMSLKVLAPAGDTERQVGTMAVLKHLLTDMEEPPPSRAATLTCLIGADVGRTFALAEASTELGRGKEAAVRLRDIAVSRRHARIRHQEGSFLLEDLDSPNGVYLNGQRVRVETASTLKEGDVIELGRTLLRFQAPMAEPPPPQKEEAPTEPEIAPAGEPASDAPPAVASREQTPERSRPRGEWWLIGLGAMLALVGLLATYALMG